MEIKTAKDLLSKVGILGLKRIILLIPENAIYYNHSKGEFYEEASAEGVDGLVSVAEIKSVIEYEDSLIEHYG